MSEPEVPGPVLAFSKPQKDRSKRLVPGERIIEARRFIVQYVETSRKGRERISCMEIFEAYMGAATNARKQNFVKALQEPDEFTGKEYFKLIHHAGESWVDLT